MCGSSKPPPDNSAQIAREAEEKRQGRISEGTSAIDSAFSSYNDDFYNQYQSDYGGYYQPQLDDQYSDARERLTLQLAKQGNLTSSTGADQFGDLKSRYDDRGTSISNEAMDASNSLRRSVDSNKSQLYADNRSSADPGNAAKAARSLATSLQPGTPSSPLADTFADFFNNASQMVGLGGGRDSKNKGVQNYGGSGNNSVVYH